MNKTILTGRLTKDVVLRKTTQGTSVVEFTIAVQRRIANAEGKREADFINCIAWKGKAENMEKYCKKGDRIGVVGSIQTRNYENKDGNKVYVTEVIADDVEFLENKKQEEAPVEETSGDDFNITEDDLPF